MAGLVKVGNFFFVTFTFFRNGNTKKGESLLLGILYNVLLSIPQGPPFCLHSATGSRFR